MDSVDQRIIGLLEMDGRLTFDEIAKRINMSRPAVAARTRRLIDNGQLDVRGAVHPRVLGQTYLGYASLDIRGAALPIANAIAERSDVPFVSVVTGARPIVAEIRASSSGAYVECIDALHELHGVRAVNNLVYLDVIRDVIGPVGEVTTSVDCVDEELLRHLQTNGRISYVDLAARVALSPAGVRRRVRTLIDNNVLRVGAVVRHAEHDRYVAMGLAVRINGCREAVERKLTALDSVIFLARTIGYADMLMTVRTYSVAQLASTADLVRSLDGVEEVTSWAHLEVVKEAYAAVFTH